VAQREVHGVPQVGLTLIELLLALLLGAVLSLGVTQLFVRGKISYLQDEEMARLQENGRYALRYLTREMNMAGYLANVLWAGNVASAPGGTACFDHLIDTRRPIEFYNDVTENGPRETGLSTLPDDCLAHGSYAAGTDMLLVRRTLDSPSVRRGNVIAPMDPNTIYLRSETYPALVSLVKGGGRVLPAADIWEYFPQLLFLRNYSIERKDGVPALCRVRLAPRGNRLARTECLVEGIEDMQFEFGIDDDGDQQADRFESAPSPQDMHSAMVAHIFLLVRSIRPIHGYSNDKHYSLGSKLLAPANDGFYRLVVQTSVMLRNSPAYKP